ncbi:MAG TPA: DUF3047 domain-containing protein [Fontimonas sp.]
MPTRNAPSALPTTLRFMASRLQRRFRGQVDAPDHAAFRRRVDAALVALAPQVERCDWLTVSGRTPDWTPAAVLLRAGERVTVLAHGRVYVSRGLDVGFGPQVGLWYRIGSGPVGKLIGEGSTIHAATGGALQFTCKPSGEFADEQGNFDPAIAREPLSGEFSVAVIRWRGDAQQAQQAAAAQDAALFGPVLRRSEQTTTPAGWNYLWRLGDGEIYRNDTEAGALCCNTHADVGILRFPLRRALTSASTLSWAWCVEQLPSQLAEHTQPTHDYLSIAVEFDNGLDLTWMWSAALPVDTIFQCPLPWWDQRETHWVVRSGTQALGEWLNEKRDLIADYRRAIGGELPREIVAVWLIANTAFQRGVGKCRYRGIVIADADGRVVVQP